MTDHVPPTEELTLRAHECADVANFAMMLADNLQRGLLRPKLTSMSKFSFALGTEEAK